MRASFAFCIASACALAAAACSNTGGVASTFSAVTGGAGGAGAGTGLAGGATVSSTTSSSQATTTTTSATTTTTSTTTSTTSSSGTGGGGACSYDAPAPCSNPEQLTQISGDTGSDMDMATGSTSKWFDVNVHDSLDPFSSDPESFTATLTSPPGMQFDLYVYEGDVNGPDCFAAAQPASGDPETFSDMWPDGDTTDDSRWISLEVRYVSGTACGAEAQWSLTVAGHTQ